MNQIHERYLSRTYISSSSKYSTSLTMCGWSNFIKFSTSFSKSFGRPETVRERGREPDETRPSPHGAGTDRGLTFLPLQSTPRA